MDKHIYLTCTKELGFIAEDIRFAGQKIKDGSLDPDFETALQKVGISPDTFATIYERVQNATTEDALKKLLQDAGVHVETQKHTYFNDDPETELPVAVSNTLEAMVNNTHPSELWICPNFGVDIISALKDRGMDNADITLFGTAVDRERDYYNLKAQLKLGSELLTDKNSLQISQELSDVDGIAKAFKMLNDILQIER